MTLPKAIRMLREEYERAKKLEYVYNPLAWALYRVWKEADKTEVKPKKKPKEVSPETRNALNKMGQAVHGGKEEKQ